MFKYNGLAGQVLGPRTYLNSCKEKTDGDTDGHFRVVMMSLLAVLIDAVRLLQNEDQVRCFFQIWFVPVRLQLLQVLHPRFAHAPLVVDLLFVLNYRSNVRFHFWVGNDDVCPRLTVRPTRTCSCFKTIITTNLRKVIDVTFNIPAVLMMFLMTSTGTGLSLKKRSERRLFISSKKSFERFNISSNERCSILNGI